MCGLTGSFVFVAVTFSVVITGFDVNVNNHIVDLTRSGVECETCSTKNPDEDLTAPQIIRRHGYASESHVVETEDGYLLTIHRIPANKDGRKGVRPVLVQHGMLSSSADWVDKANGSLAFMLSDEGYDVWLGNCRGNTYSRAHVSLPVHGAQFWNFSFHEMGVKDLPAVLSYIGSTTGNDEEIVYIGHSMGTTMFFIMASELPDVAKRVKLMVGLAPVAYMTHIRSPIRYLAPWVNDFQWLSKHLGFHDFVPNNKLLEILANDCRLIPGADSTICKNLMFALFGFDKAEFDEDLLPVVVAHAPAGASTKTFVHYAQEINDDGNFQAFDYGTEGNIAEYGTPKPPLYPLGNIQVPTYLMYAESDWLASPIDVTRLAQNLTKNVGLYKVGLNSFTHLDFLWAKDGPALVYKPLIDFIKNREEEE